MLLKPLALGLTAAVAALAANPVGGGSWTKVSPSYSIQECAGADVNGNNYKLPSEPNGSTSGPGCSNGHLRAERRYQNDYNSGVHQFAGKFKINSLGGDRIALKQTFNGPAGPDFMLAVDKSGRIYNVRGGDTIATGVAKVGATVQVHTVHDTGARKMSVYINGKNVYNTGTPGGSFYDKYGAYTTDSGSGPAEVTWSDVAFWTQ